MALRVDKKTRTFFVHRLVAKAFCPNPDGKPQVNHLNGIRSDNAAANLQWVTCSENHDHADFVLSQRQAGKQPWVKVGGRWEPSNA